MADQNPKINITRSDRHNVHISVIKKTEGAKVDIDQFKQLKDFVRY